MIRHEEVLDENVASNSIWPEDSLARVPYWVYQDEANYQRELRRIFEGPTWNFVCLEADIPEEGRLPHQPCRRHAGDRGARARRLDQLLRESLRPSRRADRLRRWRQRREQLQVHLPRLELRPRRQPQGHRLRARHRRRRRHAARLPARDAQPAQAAHRRRSRGLVFATLSPDTPSIEEYLGAEVLGRVRRVLKGPIRR